MPHVEAKLRKRQAADQLDALLDITVHHRIPIRFTTKTSETKKNELWRSQYVEGFFRGEGAWKLEAVDGNTKLNYRWRVCPSELLLRILVIFVNIPKGHSAVMKATQPYSLFKMPVYSLDYDH